MDKEIVNQNIITSIENNIRRKLQYIPSKLNSMKVIEISDTLLVDSGLPSDTFNTAYGGKISNDIAKKVMDFYKKNNTPMAWWIGPSSEDKHMAECLQGAGFTHDEYDVGMVAEIFASQHKYPALSNLEIKQCKVPKDFKDFGEVLSSIFEPIDEYVQIFYQKVCSINENVRKDLILFVGYDSGKPVATSALFLTDVAGIYDISTRPEERNKGYGSAMFCFALEYAQQHSFKLAVLQASPDGLNIYKRFGFKELCGFNVWSNKYAI